MPMLFALLAVASANPTVHLDVTVAHHGRSVASTLVVPSGDSTTLDVPAKRGAVVEVEVTPTVLPARPESAAQVQIAFVVVKNGEVLARPTITSLSGQPAWLTHGNPERPDLRIDVTATVTQP